MIKTYLKRIFDVAVRGDYKVCERWLKDGKGRKRSLEDIKHYCKVVTALEKTIAIQKEIDKIYPRVEENLITRRAEFHGLARG